MNREYSDFIVMDLPRRPVISRRWLVVGGSAIVASGGVGIRPASSVSLTALADGINAVTGLVTNFDALAGKVWSKVEGFFGNGKSSVSNDTMSRVANEVGNLLTDPNNVAVSITENRTPQIQTGSVQHHFSQDFSQAYLDWCTCNAQMYSNSSAMWRQAAADLRARGDAAGAQAALNKAGEDQRKANGFIAKMTNIASYEPVRMALPPKKPILTALPPHNAVVSSLDKGDYFVCHAVAQTSRDAKVSYLA